jgi:hypothetical protein
LNQLNWPEDERDVLTRLAKELIQAHFDVQVVLIHFHMDASVGAHVDDTTYSEAFRAIGRLQRASVNLRIALVAYRTTSRLPVVRDNEQS